MPLKVFNLMSFPLFISTLFLSAARPFNTEYPLFSITNKNPCTKTDGCASSSWSQADVEVTAHSFTFSDGIRNTSVLAELAEANPHFTSLRYCNPRGIAYDGASSTSSASNLLTFSDFERRHRKEALFYTGGFLAKELDGSADDVELLLAHPLDARHGGDNRSLAVCALRDWVLVPSSAGSGDVSTLLNKTTMYVLCHTPQNCTSNSPPSRHHCKSGTAPCCFLMTNNGCPVRCTLSAVRSYATIVNKQRSFVTYLMIDDELLKIVAIDGAENRAPSDPPFDRQPPPPATVTVVRGFGGSAVSRHVAGARVLSPVSLDQGV